MSYDLDLFTLEDGVAPITTIERAAMSAESGVTAQNRRLAQQLESVNPDFEIETSPDSIDVMNAETGIKIGLYRDGAHVSISYWHSDDTSVRQVFKTVRRCLQLLQTQTGYAIYDPQLGRVVDMDADLPQMIATYTHAMSRMQSIF